MISEGRADQVYRDSDIPLSFRYPDGWHLQTPQLANTRVLLYASDGSLGTCNVGATARNELADLAPDRLRMYNLSNHRLLDLERSLKKLYPDFHIVNYWTDALGYQDAGYIVFDHTLRVLNLTTETRFVLASTFSEGYWFTVVCNAPRDQFARVYPAFRYIARTLLFMH